MAGPGNKKRTLESRTQRPVKKFKRQKHYNSDSDSPENDEFDAANPADSDDDAAGPSSVNGADEAIATTKTASKPKSKMSLSLRKQSAKEPEESEQDDAEEDALNDDSDDTDMDDDDEDPSGGRRKQKSKRNDPNAFATSLSKILSTKLSTSKRPDPVLARSADARTASRAVTDTALESKAKRQLREQKRMAKEKGRVKDVLLATRTAADEPEGTTAEILETERRLRKVAQRGVVRLFNAVRAAQVQALTTEKDNRKGRVIGTKNREEKVSEMSKKGFLELIASGGGGLKKGALEEA